MTDRALRFHHVLECDSTQQLVRTLLDEAPAALHAVRSDAQRAGVGRMERTWENPPGAALLLSIGLRDAGNATQLVGLVRRVVEELRSELEQTYELSDGTLAWSDPNDLVAADDGRKVAGILADALTVEERIRELRVGIGVNVSGATWRTRGDARDVTTLEQIAGRSLDTDPGVLDALAQRLAMRVVALLD